MDRIPCAPLVLTSFTATSGVGVGNTATLASLRSRRGGLRPCDFDGVDVPTWIGTVDGADTQPLPPEWRRYDCRNNRLAELALDQDGLL